MNSDAIQFLLMVVLALVTTVAGVVFWRWWREADTAQRRAVVREAARWAVLAAEYLHDQPRTGPTKITWVLAHLRRRFPDIDDATLTRQAEKAVHALNTNKAASTMARLNGKGPQHGSVE